MNPSSLTSVAIASARSSRRHHLLVFGLLFVLATSYGAASLEEARAALEKGDFREALRQSQAAVTDDPVAAYQVRADAYAGLGEAKLATGQVQRALSYEPQNRTLILRAAELLRDAKMPQQAADYYESALEARADDWETIVAYRNLLSQLNRNQDIVALAKRSIPLLQQGTEPYAEAHRLLASAHEELEQWPEAAAALDVAVRAGEPNGMELLKLGRFYHAAKDYSNASITLQKARQAVPTNESAMFYLAESLWELGSHDEATALYSELIERSSSYESDISWEKRKETLSQTTPAARLIHEEYGLLPFVAGIVGLLLIMLIAAAVMWKRLSNDE